MKTLIDLRERGAVERRRPLLVAHRGAVGPGAPENSLAALRGAAEAGYDLVEIDVDAARDGVPVLFHGDRAGTMWVNCRIDASVGQLSSRELRGVCYRASDQHVPTLDEALDLCASLRIGVVLDIKTSSSTPVAFHAQVGELVERHCLSAAAMLLSENPAACEALAGKVVPMATRQDHARALAGETISLMGQFWPAFADRLTAREVAILRSRGALVLATVAPRLYPPHAHHELAGDDIARLCSAGAHLFLIDDVYRGLFRAGSE
jgi:glycerophosphoryl diester phosphodiesterase